MSNAISMIRACYVHQHPEEYGRPPVDEPALPSELRYGSGEGPVASTTAIPEEAMGVDCGAGGS